jgi:hypothetical protein
MLETYTLPQIKQAVDIAVGDDGMRSEEVIDILKNDNFTINTELENKEELELSVSQLIDKIEQLEQSIINIDAKYKIKINEIMLMFES